MAFMYDYLTEAELEIEKESRLIDMEGLRLINAMEAVNMRHELDVKAVETKAIFENWTDSELMSGYSRELAIYTEGVKDLWEKFKALIRNIINKILGRKVDESAALQSADEVTLDHDPSKIGQIIDDCGKAIKSALSLKKTDENGNSVLNVQKIMIGGSSVAGIGGAIAYLASEKKKGHGFKTAIKNIPGYIKALIGKLNIFKKDMDSIKADETTATNTNSSNTNSGNDKSGDNNNSHGKIMSKIISLGTSVADLAQRAINQMKSIVEKITGKGKGNKDSQDNSNVEGSATGTENNGASDSSSDNTNDSANDANESDTGDEPKSETPKEEPKKDEKPAESSSDKTASTASNKYKASLYGLVQYSLDHNATGLNGNNAALAKGRNDRNRKGKKGIKLNNKELENIYNAAKKNGDVDSAVLDKWRTEIRSKGVMVEFVNDDIIVTELANDSIFESMDFENIFDDGLDLDDMFEATDTSAIDDISDIFDEFFS